MNTKRRTKWIHEGKYAAKVEVDLILEDDGWAPYLSKEDALKLDEIRKSLREGDVRRAAQSAKVYKLNSVAG